MSKNIKINVLIDNFIKDIIELDNTKKTLEDKLNVINNLMDNLLDYCIKKKIFFFVENKIGYNNIVFNFKSYLANFIRNLVDPDNKILTKYIVSNSNQYNYDNVSDINSLMFNNFKKLNEYTEKNVSFKNSDYFSTNYDNGDDGFDFNYKPNSNSNLNNNYDDNLSLLIKILISQNKYIIEFTEKLNVMCKIISDSDVKYKKTNPFD